MKEPIIYLDSSAIVKRYVKEVGSDLVRSIYLRTYSGEVILSYSVWNIGEVLGAFDKARKIGRISEDTFNTIRRRFLLETKRMMKLGRLILVPLRTKVLRECWELIMKYHIYEADAIQITSAKYVGAEEFLTGDEQLHEIAIREGLKSNYLG